MDSTQHKKQGFSKTGKREPSGQPLQHMAAGGGFQAAQWEAGLRESLETFRVKKRKCRVGKSMTAGFGMADD